MTDLSERLDSVQERILSLIEKNSEFLDDHIEYWDCIRKEQLLLHYARKQGYGRLLGQTVPSLQSSEVTAKQAIEMLIHLRSLRKSRYGAEPWTLTDTSRETFMNDPPFTFKKHPYIVDLQFDDDPENVVRLTNYRRIYHQNNGDDDWSESPGLVDYIGMYYKDDGLLVYFADFKEQAQSYSNTGLYQVMFDGKVLTADSVDSVPQQRGATPDSSEESTSGTATPPGSSSKKKGPPKSVRLRRRRGGYPRRSSGPAGQPRKPRKSRDSPRSRGLLRAAAPVSPEEVGGHHSLVGRRSGSRLQTLLQEARDPPCLGLRGTANQLKHFRFQIKKKYSQLCKYVSTSFYWTCSKSTARVGRPRMLIVFENEGQRERFSLHVNLPKGIESFKGSLFGM
uniref:Regulatory protein E2 n=1 Tax=Mops bat papillomavirus TaxID=3141892 RepID=A0AAU7E3T1_9PAPI